MVKAKEIEGLDCAASAARGMWLVLATRLGEMCEHRAAAVGPEGEDGVHDMRVASRRLRSVLRDFGPYLRGGKRLEAAREELKLLAGALGAVRDEDVAIRLLEKLKTEADASVAEGLELLAFERRARRDGALAALESALAEESFESFRLRVASAFERATEPRRAKRRKGEGGGGGEGEGREDGDALGGGARGESGDGGPSFEESGREIIGRLWDELRGRGQDIYRPLKSGRLHKLRIAAKRLRYALELFAACYGEAQRELAHELARLQTALGELHDCDGWVEECGRLLEGRKASDGSQGRRASDDSRGDDADDSRREEARDSRLDEAKDSRRDSADDSDLRGARQSRDDAEELSLEGAKQPRPEEQSRPEAPDESTARRDAAFWLLAHFSARRAEHYVEALKIWRGLERDGFGVRLDESMKGSQKSEH
jgi:CHAD domain-containing protein